MGKVEDAREELTVYLPDTRGVTVSRWGKGNTKLGPDVYTYSRLPGRKKFRGTCPGMTKYCDSICYARRVITCPPVWDLWTRNSETEDIPRELPPGAKFIRLHVSGDFTTSEYILHWIKLMAINPGVMFWAYTRSWQLEELLTMLEIMRDLPNIQLFASVDKDTGLAPEGWRVAFIENDPQLAEIRNDDLRMVLREDGTRQYAYVCPEETGRKPNCQACQYCITGRKGDVVFLKH